MEQWQRDFITANGPKLLNYTSCNTELLMILKSKNVLGTADLSSLDAAKNSSEGYQAQVRLLYEIIQTRLGAYAAIIEALHETRQSGARNLLLYGYVQHGITPPFKFGEEIFCWNTDHFSLGEQILSKLVNVQGRKMRLADVCRNIEPETLDEMMKRTIDKTNIFNILNDKVDFTLISDTVPEEVKYYIHRTFTKRTRLHMSILKAAGTDVFIVIGILLHQLRELAFPSYVDGSGNQLERLSLRHIVSELDKDFDAICKKYSNDGKSFHLLHYKNEALYWIKTVGSISMINHYVHHEQDQVEDESFVKHLLSDAAGECGERQPVCISDSPGMGKTILLGNIANKLKTEQEDKLVFYFVLREFVQHLPTNPKHITVDKIRQLISIQVTTSPFGKQVVQHLLSCEDQKFELFFDGFDEILEQQTEATKQLLKVICQQLPNTRLHVTTRPHMRKQLEETLCVLGYNILSFELGHQINFLVRYWQFKGNIPHENIQLLESFAKRCLETLKSKMKDSEIDIAGIPLQCRLLGEIYQWKVERLQHAPSTEDEFLVSSLHQMYERLMALRFDKAKMQQKLRNQSHFGSKRLVNFITRQISWVRKMKYVHYLAAVDLLFPEFTPLFKTIIPVDHHKYLKRREIYDLGLIEAKASFKTDYRFSHRTFAEFLFAEFIVKIIASEDRIKYKKQFGKPFLNFLFNHVFKTHTQHHSLLLTEVAGIASQVQVDGFDHSVITYFINAHLNENMLTWYNLMNDVTISIDATIFYKTFISCALSNLRTLFSILNRLFKIITHTTWGLPYVLLITAAKYGDYEFNNIIHKLIGTEGFKVLNERESYNNRLVRPMEVAVQRGNHQIVQVLLRWYGLDSILENVLHVCVVGSHFDNSATISSKVEIIKTILGEHAGLKDEKLGTDGTTPILQPNTNIKLVKCLLEKRANVNAVSANQENILHVFLNKNKDHKVNERTLIRLLKLLKKFNFTDYNRANVNGDSPLALAIQSVKLTTQSLKLFKQNGANFNTKNKMGENLIFDAIASQQSIECLKLLAANGLQLSCGSANQGTLLHAAVSSGHIEAVRFLLGDADIKGKLINSKDCNGNTPLHISFTKNDSVYIQIQNILIANGANLVCKNASGCTPVEYGLENSITLIMTVERLLHLERQGYTLSTENFSNLLRAILLNKTVMKFNNDFVELICFLVSAGGRAKCDNGRNLIELKTMKSCLSKIAQNVFAKYFFGPIQSELENVFHEISERLLSEQQDKLVMQGLLQSSFYFEAALFLILTLNDEESFSTLQKAYQLTQSRSTRFVTTFHELIDFYELTQTKLCVILTDCIIMTVAKVQDAIDSSILVINMSDFSGLAVDLDRNAVVIVGESHLSSFLSAYENTTSKIICICKTFNYSSIQNSIFLNNVAIIKDEYSWETLTPSFQKQLLQKYREYQSNINLSKLSLCEILAHDILPIDFLIPAHVKNIFTQQLNFNKNETISYHSDNALLRYAFEKVFPYFNASASSSTNNYLIPEEFKELVLHGPTASYLAAIWISRNFNELRNSDKNFLRQLFSCSSVKIEMKDPLEEETLLFHTYEFDNLLLVYFLKNYEKLYTEKNTILEKFMSQHQIFHACINLYSPKLLNLFAYKFPLTTKTLTVASALGIIHMFSKHINMFDVATDSSYGQLLAVAVQNIYLHDVKFLSRYAVDFRGDIKLLERTLVYFCLENTFSEDLQTVEGRLQVLKLLEKNNVLNSKQIGISIQKAFQPHIKILKYLIKFSHSQDPFWRLSENFVDMISTYMSDFEIYDVVQFAFKHGQQHLLLSVKGELISKLSDSLTKRDFKSLWKFATSAHLQVSAMDMILRHFENYNVCWNELHVAIRHGNIEAVKYFILHGANVNALCVCCKKKYIHLASTAPCNKRDIFLILLKYMVEPSSEVEIM